MLSLYFFIALALLGLFSPAKTAPSLQITEVGDSFVTNDKNIIPFDPNHYIPISPYTPTGPVLKAQIDDFSLASGFEFNSATEPVILAQISDQGVVPNPDPGNWVGDPEIEAGGICRKTKRLYCCKGQYDTRTQKVDQPCMLWRTEEAIFCDHATFYCCFELDGQTNGKLCSPISTAI